MKRLRILNRWKLFLAIRTEQAYDAAVARLNALVDEVGDNPKNVVIV